MKQDLLFKLGVMVVYILVFVLYSLVMNTVPFCPVEKINYIADMSFCSSYLWAVIVPSIIMFTAIAALLYWEKVKSVHYPLAIFPAAILVLLIGMGTSASALNGWVGAIGPETLVTSSIYSVPVVVVLTTLVYASLIIFILKRIDRSKFSKKYWSTFFVALVIYTSMIVFLYIELSSLLKQLGRS